MDRTQLSVTIITLNEEHNLARAIASVKDWADDILVVDSGSQDRTCEIAASLGARVLQNAWRGYGQQKNFAQTHARHDWVLSLDADEAVSPALAKQIQTTLKNQALVQAAAFSLPRLSFYLGRWIRHGGWYPNRSVRLANRQHARWSEPEVHEQWMIDGQIHELSGDLFHYPFTDIDDQVRTNLNYARLGSECLIQNGLQKKPGRLFLKLLFKPIGKFLETYVIKRGFLDGMPGFIISINAAHSLFLKYAHLYEENPS